MSDFVLQGVKVQLDTGLKVSDFVLQGVKVQ